MNGFYITLLKEFFPTFFKKMCIHTVFKKLSPSKVQACLVFHKHNSYNHVNLSQLFLKNLIIFYSYPGKKAQEQVVGWYKPNSKFTFGLVLLSTRKIILRACHRVFNQPMSFWMQKDPVYHLLPWYIILRNT